MKVLLYLIDGPFTLICLFFFFSFEAVEEVGQRDYARQIFLIKEGQLW